MGTNSNPAPLTRQIRVFISSTFRDMMRERDLLVKEVFPELRRKCAKRFVTFTEVDLRWGITEAQANEGPTLKRIQPRAQGRAFAIHKPMTHITVVVENRES